MKFTFYQDVPETITRRETYVVDAPTQEEAIDLIKKDLEENFGESYFVESEYLFESGYPDDRENKLLYIKNKTGITEI